MKRFVVLALVAGCLQVPESPGQECTSSSECDSGESCSEGMCYGAPPDGLYAAAISAPTSTDNVGRELASISLPQDGDLGDLQLDAAVTISGRVEIYCDGGTAAACSNNSIAARVLLVRPSRIPGAPTVRYSVQSKPDIPRGTDSFTIRVPRTLPGDEPWTVTIDPDGGGDVPATNGGTGPAELVPPKRLELVASDDVEHQTYTLGHADSVTISGTLRDAFQNPLPGYRVVAMGRWEGDSTPTEVSSVDFSTDGTYSITIADGVRAPLEIVAKPFGEGVVAPTLQLTGVALYSQTKNLTQPAGIGQPVTIHLPVTVRAGSGDTESLPGVRVIATGTVSSMLAAELSAVFSAEATTDADGIATLTLLDGPAVASSYHVRFVPPAGSSYGVDERAITLTSTQTVELPSRVAIRGTVLDVDGNPLPGVSVTAKRSLRFLWSVMPADQGFLDDIPATTALTTDAGEFVVWVDPAVAGAWASYDLFFEPPVGSAAPNWWVSDVPIERAANPSASDLGNIRLPDAARLRARIIDADGDAVEGSSLRLFELSGNESLCMEVLYPPETCAPTPIVLGHGDSDSRGKLTLTLPRP